MAVAPPQTQSPGLLQMLVQHLTGQSQQPQQSSTAAPADPTYAPQGLGADDPSLQYLSGSVPPDPTQNAPVPITQSGATPDPNGATQVAGVTVTGKRSAPSYASDPQGYSNSSELSGLQAQQAAQPPAPRSTHGTLGTLLGNLGDAFLVGSGRAPQYQPRMDQQSISQAMVGAETNPRAAAARVAATGVPGAEEASQKLIEQANEQDRIKQQQTQNFQFQQARIGDVQNANLQRAAPAAQLLMRGAKPNGADWSSRLSQVDSMLGRYGTDPRTNQPFDHTSIGIPDQYDPMLGTSGGETGGQIGRDTNAANSQATSRRDTDVNAGARITSAQISAAARLATQQPSQAAYIKELTGKVSAGTATPAEQQYFEHIAAPSRQSGIHLGVGGTGAPPVHPGSVPISMAGANNPVANGGRAVTPQQAASLPKGTHFLTSDGRWLVR